MGRIRTGRPNGRPPLPLEGKKEGEMIDLHMKAPVEIIEKIDRLRKGAETRKDVILRVLREYAE